MILRIRAIGNKEGIKKIKIAPIKKYNKFNGTQFP